jgi:hypothetical protein
VNYLFQVVIPAIAGLVSGGIASLVAPWVNWRIEQKREKLAHKRALIRRWRVSRDGFRSTRFYGHGCVLRDEATPQFFHARVHRRSTKSLFGLAVAEI